MTNNKKIAVVTLNYNKKDDCLSCLRSIYASDCSNISVVVVDNNSSDGSADAIASTYPNTPLIRNKQNVGVAKGRNMGWRYAKENFDSEILIFLDDDVEVAPEYFSNVVRVFQDRSDIGIITAKAYVDWNTKIFCSVGLSVNFYTGLIYDIGRGQKDEGHHDTPCYRDACGGFAIAIRRDLFESAGGFDESYSPYGWEDADLCLRARDMGYRTFYMPTAVVVHKGTKMGRDPKPAYERNKIKNYLLLLKRHTNIVQKLCCCIGVPLKGLYIIGEMVLTGHARVITAQCRGFFEGLRTR
ncbi:MAG: glycosyltransferase family 2 protein [Candidatus Omnitrophica bacterium]|nr:glycosyltransferase family 2 protein [Candidatus Omnitrophota bacterium]